MRILFVSQEMPPETAWGGIGTYVEVASESLAAKGHEVHVLSVVERQPPSRAERGGVVVHRLAVPSAPDPTRRLPEAWRRLALAAAVARLLPTIGLRPDVVECPEWMAEGLGLGFSAKVPLVVRLHSSARQIFPLTGQGRWCRGWDGRLAIWLEETAARRAQVVTSTQANLEEMADTIGLSEQALHAIPVPVRRPPLTPISDSAAPRVLFVGRLGHRKAPELILRAAPRVLAVVPEAKFVFVGRDVGPAHEFPSSGWLREEGRRLGVADALEFTGQLDRAGVQSELERATVCAFPSRWESFGYVVAEASAAGRPVVVTPIAPFRELVQDGVTGRVVASGDIEGWARAIVECLVDRSLARRMGEAGAERIAAKSDPGRVADLTLGAYEHAVERRRLGLRAGRSRSGLRRGS